MSYVKVDDASKKFKEHIVFQNVNLCLDAGCICGIIGRNGCGKTVLLKSICGFIPLSSGSICVDGKIIGKDVEMPGDTSIIIETPGFLPQYNCFSNLKFLANIKRKISPNDIRNALLAVGLDPSDKKQWANIQWVCGSG